MRPSRRTEVAYEAEDQWRELGRLVKRARNRLGLNQEDVADQLTAYLDRPVTQTKVSRNEKGAEWDIDLIRGYLTVLRLSPADVNRIITGIEDDEQTSDLVSFEALVHGDPELTDTAKAHLIAQYTLLKEASAYARETRDRPNSGTA